MALTPTECTRQYRLANLEKVKAREREYHRNVSPERKAQWNTNRRERIKADPVYQEKRRALCRAYYHSHKEKYYLSVPKSRMKLRLDVLIAYGGHCACCGERQEEFLALDHMDGGGGKDRKNGMRSEKLYAWLRRNHYPAGYQILCHNCNFAKSLRGGCPHVMERILVNS